MHLLNSSNDKNIYALIKLFRPLQEIVYLLIVSLWLISFDSHISGMCVKVMQDCLYLIKVISLAIVLQIIEATKVIHIQTCKNNLSFSPKFFSYFYRYVNFIAYIESFLRVQIVFLAVVLADNNVLLQSISWSLHS